MRKLLTGAAALGLAMAVATGAWAAGHGGYSIDDVGVAVSKATLDQKAYQSVDQKYFDHTHQDIDIDSNFFNWQVNATTNVNTGNNALQGGASSIAVGIGELN